MIAKMDLIFTIMLIASVTTLHVTAGKASLSRSLRKIKTTMRLHSKNVDNQANKINTLLNKVKDNSETVDRVSSSLSTIADALPSFTSNDVTSIVTGTIDVISGISQLIPVVGPIISSVFSLISSVIGIIGGGTEDIGTVVRKEITKALNTYDDSQLRAEAVATERLFRNSQAYLNAKDVNHTTSIKEHEIAALAANVPLYKHVEFLGILQYKIHEHSSSTDETQIKRAISYAKIYVKIAVFRSAILWKMYSLVRSADHSAWTANAIKRYIESEEKADVKAVRFLTEPTYSKALFFAYLNPSDLPEISKFLNVRNLHFQNLTYLTNSKRRFRPQRWTNYYMVMYMYFKSMVGVKEASLGEAYRGDFEFSNISSPDSLFYVRIRSDDGRYWYLTMGHNNEGRCYGVADNRGYEAQWKVVKYEDGTYMLSPRKWLNWFIYMKNDAAGTIRGWKGDPGPQGHWYIE